MFLNTPEGPQKIERISSSKDSIILGVYISLDGSSNKQKMQLREITTAWAKIVRSVHNRKDDACYYYQSTVLKSLEYPLVATIMLQSQYHSVESLDLCSALQSSGLPRNLQRYIGDDPISLLGLSNGTLYGTQGKNHIQDLMDHGYSNNTTGHNLRDLIKAHTLEELCSRNIFSNNLPYLSVCISPSCISHTWTFMRDNNISLE